MEKQKFLFSKTPRGFRLVECNSHNGISLRLLQESSAVGEYEDSLENPGSSFLWIGEHHLNREEVTNLILILQHWLVHKHLPETKPG